MTADQLKKLRAYYHSLRHFQPIFENAPTRTVHLATVKGFDNELQRIATDFPGLLPQLNTLPHASPHQSQYYYSAGLQSLLGIALGRLEIAVEEASSTPITEPKEFPFVRDSALRNIVERDYQELQQAYIAKCWKSVIILAGGTIEAILTDILLQPESLAQASTKAPKDRAGKVQEIQIWGLVYLILVAVDLRLVNPGVEKLSHSIREYRDLVHPMVEIKSALHVEPEEAKIAVEVLNMIHRDLSK
jgi:hypothetical protein